MYIQCNMINIDIIATCTVYMHECNANGDDRKREGYARTSLAARPYFVFMCRAEEK